MPGRPRCDPLENRRSVIQKDRTRRGIQGPRCTYNSAPFLKEGVLLGNNHRAEAEEVGKEKFKRLPLRGGGVHWNSTQLKSKVDKREFRREPYSELRTLRKTLTRDVPTAVFRGWRLLSMMAIGEAAEMQVLKGMLESRSCAGVKTWGEKHWKNYCRDKG